MPSPSLIKDVLKDICKQLSYDDGLDEALKFALSGVEPMNAFMELLTTVKSVEFKHYGVKAVFNWATYYLNFEGDLYSKVICSKILSYTPELTIFVDDIESRHMEFLHDWPNNDRLKKVCVEYAGHNTNFLEPVMSRVLNMPIKHLVADASSLIPFISTIDDREYDNVELRFENGYFDRLETMLTSFRFHSKNVTLSFSGEYTWYEILYVVTKVVKENSSGAVSTLVENLTLNFNGDIDVPALPELQLTDFFEDISKCFPNLKNVKFCIDFTFNAEGFLTEEDASIELYVSTYTEVIKQVSKAKTEYNLFVEWIREDHVVDISPTNTHFVSLCEALTNDLGFKKIDDKESCWEVEKKITDKKSFKMTVTLIQPSFQDFDMHEEILYDAGILMGDEYPSDYDPNEEYDYEYEDYEGGDYDEFFDYDDA
uniref:Uncharacterized protein n=1 Tax=Panagrolaimus superbus TaxID=310955 RepID=A0A914YZ58_9BILA